MIRFACRDLMLLEQMLRETADTLADGSAAAGAKDPFAANKFQYAATQVRDAGAALALWLLNTSDPPAELVRDCCGGCKAGGQ